MRLILCCLIFASLSTNLLAEDSPAPANAEQAIKDHSKDVDAAWNKHDAQAFAAYYTVNGDIVTESGDPLSGREGIQQALSDAFGGQLKDSILTTTISSVRLIRPDVALVDAEAELKIGDAEPRKFHVLSVVVNKDGKWLTETTRAIHYQQQ